MEIIKDFIPENRKNRPGIPMNPKWITIHDTANARTGADAFAHAEYLKGDEAESKPVSWHFSVDGGSIAKDGTVKPPQIYQHLPTDEIGWHAGDGHGAGNMASIGVEICENIDGDRARAEALAAELVAWLCKQYNIPVLNVVQHSNWAKKDCPRVLRNRPGGWDNFIAQVKMNMEKTEPPEWKVVGLKWLEENGFITPGRWKAEDQLDMGTLGVILSRLTITGKRGEK